MNKKKIDGLYYCILQKERLEEGRYYARSNTFYDGLVRTWDTNRYKENLDFGTTSPGTCYTDTPATPSKVRTTSFFTYSFCNKAKISTFIKPEHWRSRSRVFYPTEK